VVWIGLCQLGLEERLLAPIGLGGFVGLGARSAFNPFEQLAGPATAWAFLAVRFLGLAVVVAVIEEFLLRGFVMRLFVDADWADVPFGNVNLTAVLIGAVIYPVLTHPAEAFAAVAWFSLITLLMVRTRNIWDCVVAHGITNLLLGLWVLYSGQWHLI
jgi:CAAX prenyl protease-like protein